MKTYMVRMAGLAAAAVVMIAGSAFAGQTQAEREYNLGRSPGFESAPEWQIRPAQETGSVPADHAREMKPGAGSAADVVTVEIGGSAYRIGVDLP
ncbi:MAG: hypothetical protein HZB86_04530 [Deltaproteobacteria bacterium]|nr:hypothetical protein [Deltaproteobacteria bacterium]